MRSGAIDAVGCRARAVIKDDTELFKKVHGQGVASALADRHGVLDNVRFMNRPRCAKRILRKHGYPRQSKIEPRRACWSRPRCWRNLLCIGVFNRRERTPLGRWLYGPTAFFRQPPSKRSFRFHSEDQNVSWVVWRRISNNALAQAAHQLDADRGDACSDHVGD